MANVASSTASPSTTGCADVGLQRGLVAGLVLTAIFLLCALLAP